MRLIPLIVALISFPFCFGQIVIENTEDEKKEKREKADLTDFSKSQSEVFLGMNVSNTFRELKNGKVIKTQNFTADNGEKSVVKSSFQLGLRSKINSFLLIEAGIAVLNVGEEFQFQELDSSYTSNRTYQYISAPIRLYYTYGNKFKLMAGVGVAPQGFIRLIENVNTVSTTGAEDNDRVISKSGYSTFVWSASGIIGFRYAINPIYSVYLSGEYRRHLTNDFSTNAKTQHFAYATGINFGIGINLKN